MTQGYVNAIYRATEGEGVHLGTPQVFVRLQGCAIGCLNCDSKDTWDFDRGGQSMGLSEVLDEVAVESLEGLIKRVSITGGDPLHPKHIPFVEQLVPALKALGHSVVLEAAGTRLVHRLFDVLDFINMDIKTPSTGVRFREEVIRELAAQYPGRYQIKAVIENKADFDFYLAQYQSLSSLTGEAIWVATPAYNLNEQFPLERFQNIIEWNYRAGAPFRVIGQQHKWMFGPDVKKV